MVDIHLGYDVYLGSDLHQGHASKTWIRARHVAVHKPRIWIPSGLWHGTYRAEATATEAPCCCVVTFAKLLDVVITPLREPRPCRTPRTVVIHLCVREGPGRSLTNPRVHSCVHSTSERRLTARCACGLWLLRVHACVRVLQSCNRQGWIGSVFTC